MPTYVPGTYYSDLAVGKKESVTDDLLEAVPGQTPFLNSIGFPGTGIFRNHTHTYLDDAYVPLRSTLNGAHAAADTTFTFTTAIFKPGQIVEIQGETILLGTVDATGKIFSGCTRSVGTPAAPTTHATGVPVINVGRPGSENDTAGSADISAEPRSVTTYVHIHERVCEVPYGTDQLERYGRPGSAYDDKISGYMRDMHLEAEATAMWSTASAPVGSTEIAGKLGGFWERVVGTTTTAMAAADFTAASLRDAVEDIALYYDPDIAINAVMLVPIRQTFVFNEWQQAHVVVAPGDPLIAKYGVQAKRLQIGPMVIDVIGSNRFYDQAPLYQPQYIKPLIFGNLGPTHEMLAKTGRQTRGHLYMYWTLETYVPEAHYTFSGLKTG